MKTRAKVTYLPNKLDATHICITGQRLAVISQAQKIAGRKTGWRLRDGGTSIPAATRGDDKNAICWMCR